MDQVASTDITAMLEAWKDGDGVAFDALVAAIYPELRRLAHRQLAARGPGDSLESSALAHEAYLKLVRAGGLRCEGRAHFLALCAQVMRRILVDHARDRGAAKRGGGGQRVPLDKVMLGAAPPAVDVLALEEALRDLARRDGRKARGVELRYFGGLTVEEIAQVLAVSTDTVKRDWRMARAWLLARLSQAGSGDQRQTPPGRSPGGAAGGHRP